VVCSDLTYLSRFDPFDSRQSTRLSLSTLKGVRRYRSGLLCLALLVAAPTSTAYADTGNIESWCDRLGNRLHSVSVEDCRAQNFVAAQEKTAQGNVLAYCDVDPAQTAAPSDTTRRILVIGGIHGDELTSVSTVFRWLEWARQPDAAGYRWRIIPAANPDGLLAQPPTRVNANGIDINRNFQTPDWDKEAQTYWDRHTKRDPRRYPGKQAGSEIETRWLQQQIEVFQPDLIISVHAPYNLLDYDGPVPQPMRFGRLSLNRLGVYPGSMGNYSGLFKQIPAITIELPNATVMPSQRDQLAMWQDMIKWMQHSIGTAGN
jgi:murein peptide amidase A